MTREPIYAALFAKLQATAGVNVASRRLRHWTDVSGAEQPALFMAQVSETAVPQSPAHGVPTKWTLDVRVYVYVKARQGADVGPLINPILDGITAALAPAVPGQKQTLGGLVEHAWIEGTIETDEGTLGDQSVAVVPIRILAT